MFQMSVVELKTHTKSHFFDTWTKEIDEKAGQIGHDVYLVFRSSHDDESAYIYFPTADIEGAITQLPEDVDYNATPVHCSHQIDMSLTSFEEFSGMHDLPYSGHAVEDVTAGDVLEHVSMNTVVPLYDHADSEIKSMYMFVNLSLCDPAILMSYIKHAIVSRGYTDTVDIDTVPCKYTILEVRSEMKRCNAQLYATYKQKVLDVMLVSAVENSRSKSEMEHKVSGLACELLLDNVVSCMGTMWCFTDGLWQECSSDGYIWNFLTSEFIDYLVSNGAEEIALHIMSVTIRSRMMKDIKMRLQDDGFYERLDSKRHIIRMINGVYDTIKETLSEPVPSDYVSVIAGVPYQIFDKRSHEMSRLMYILGTIFPDPEILEFFILSCCTFLEGYNSPKVFYIWWGMGNNAKSLVQTLVMKTLGDYCSSAPTSLVTGKRTDSSNATPELCHVEKRLVVFLQEPNPDEKIKAGKMKEMTGNDSMYVRQLFKSGKTMVLKAKIVIVCNNILEIPGMDAAIRRRIVVIPFTSTFLDPYEYQARKTKGTLEPNSNIIDLSVERELLNCKSAFMYLLCRRYSQWVNVDDMSMSVPDIIKEVTEDYVTRNNYQLRFIRNFMHPLIGSSVAATEIYELFKEWFRRSYPGKKVNDFEKFAKEMADEGYKDDGNGIVNDVFVSYTGELIN